MDKRYIFEVSLFKKEKNIITIAFSFIFFKLKLKIVLKSNEIELNQLKDLLQDIENRIQSSTFIDTKKNIISLLEFILFHKIIIPHIQSYYFFIDNKKSINNEERKTYILSAIKDTSIIYKDNHFWLTENCILPDFIALQLINAILENNEQKYLLYLLNWLDIYENVETVTDSDIIINLLQDSKTRIIATNFGFLIIPFHHSIINIPIIANTTRKSLLLSLHKKDNLINELTFNVVDYYANEDTSLSDDFPNVIYDDFYLIERISYLTTRYLPYSSNSIAIFLLSIEPNKTELIHSGILKMSNNFTINSSISHPKSLKLDIANFELYDHLFFNSYLLIQKDKHLFYLKDEIPKTYLSDLSTIRNNFLINTLTKK